MNIVHSIVVRNSLKDTFSYLESFKKNNPKIEVITSNTRFTLGTKYSEVFKWLGKTRKFRFEITQFIPNQTIKAITSSSDFPMEETLKVEHDEAGTRISWQVNIQPKGLSKIISPVIKSNVSKQVSQQIHQLKERLDLDFMTKTTLAFATQNHNYWL